MPRIAMLSCLILTFCGFPLISQAEVGVLPYSCNVTTLAEESGFVYYADCYMPRQKTENTNSLNDGKDAELKQKLLSQAISSFNQSARVVYEKSEIDAMFVKKEEFSKTNQKIDSLISSQPTLLGTTVEKTIKENLRDTLKALIETDKEFQQELAKLVKSK